MSPAGAFSKLLSRIELTHPTLCGNTQKLDSNWSTGDARDRELTEIVSGAIIRCVDANMFPLSSVLDAFNEFSQDFFDRQVEFLRTGEYRAKDYSEVVKAVYLDDHYMQSVYYPALLFCYLGSPNYRHIFRAVDKVTAAWRGIDCRRVLDLAGGHGFLLLHALEQLPQAVGIGIDLSPSAERFARALQRNTGWGAGRFDFRVQDFIAQSDSSTELFDAAFCCELLEHLPEPALALRALYKVIRPGGRLFVTAAVRMESVDHLTLFRTTNEVAATLNACGFEVIEESSVPFVLKRPSNGQRWQRQLDDPMVPATYVAECIRL
jgi:2-polyprenyl-3-methyl-5-hydroxy-6-metoxy-1,4-benzoquinol methylase